MIRKDRVTIFELILRGLIVFVFVFVCTLVIFPFSKGIPLKNIPDYKTVEYIEIKDTRTDTSIVIDDEDDIYYAINCIDFLKTELNSAFTSDSLGFIIISIKDKNEELIVISADDNYVYQNGTVKELKSKGVFIDAIEKLYF